MPSISQIVLIVTMSSLKSHISLGRLSVPSSANYGTVGMSEDIPTRHCKLPKRTGNAVVGTLPYGEPTEPQHGFDWFVQDGDDICHDQPHRVTQAH